MNPLENQLLRAETGAAEPRLCLRSGTRVDTGRWWCGSPVWLCVTGDELVMLAVARRRFFARVALGAVRASRYHPASGELVLEPGEGLPLHRFKLPVHDAFRLLSFLQPPSEVQPHPPTTPTC